MSDFTPLPVGTVLDKRYELVEDNASRKVQDKHILGKGGMGAVYLAHDRRLNCAVAVKQTTVPSDILGLDAFRREASLLANLSHPAIPRVQDYFDDSGSYFLVMELVRGDNLEEARNKHGGGLPFEDVLNITLQLLDALNYLHTQEKNVIHRDIKPANLKLTAHGQLKLLDFGLAKGSAGLMTTNLDSIFKGGTPAYAPPEQLKYFSTDARSDLFSAAATLYHLAVGERPAHCLIDREFAIQKGMSDPLRLANEINSNVPPEFALILHQALSLSPDKRQQSAAEMKKQLIDWQKAEVENQRRVAEAERIRLQKEIEEARQQANAERQLRFEEQKKREQLDELRKREEEEKQRHAEVVQQYFENAKREAAKRESRQKIVEKLNRKRYDELNKSKNNYIAAGLAGTSLVGVIAIGLAVSPIFTSNNVNTNAAETYSTPQPSQTIAKTPTIIPTPSPQPTIDYFQRGKDCYEKKDYDCSITNFSNHIELKPSDADAYLFRGIAYGSKGERDLAIKDYDKAVEFKPENALAYTNRGMDYANKGDYDRAIKDYDKAISINDNFDNAYFNRGLAYYNKGDYDRAIKDNTKTIELKSDHALAYFNRGRAYRNKGNYDQAIKDYNKSIELNASDVHMDYTGRGNAYSDKGDYDQAIKDYSKAIELKPDYALAYRNRANSYEKKGDLVKAQADRQKADDLEKKKSFGLAFG